MKIPPAPGVHFQIPDIALGGAPVLAAQAIDFEGGRTTALLGASGVGKSTVLRLIAGLVPLPASARIEATDGGPLRGRVAWMSQQDLLLPWRSVRRNVGLGAALRGEPADRARIDAMLARVGIAELAGRWPATLSGGQRQRAALARTLVEDRPIVLMDEPFSALDAPTRHRLQEMAAELLRGRTVLLVTHDPAEALRLAHRVILLRGRPAQAIDLPVPPGAPPRDPGDPALAAAQAALLRELAA